MSSRSFPTIWLSPFFSATYPTISSGQTTKVIIVSTPCGLNMYYKMWKDATEGRSHYIAKEIHWSAVPGRDQKWAEETIRNTSQRQFDQEFNAEFLGSTNTLINPAKLRSLAFTNPIAEEEGGCMKIYEQPQKKHTYAISVDVAEGQGLDYSAFSIIDVTEVPYKQVAVYKNNEIAPILLAPVVFTWGKKYNDAFLLVEINSIGLQVADILHFELGYENLLKFMTRGKQGTVASGGFAGGGGGGGRTKISFGVRTSVQTKNIGCSNLKALVESDKLLINDADTVMELSTFSASGKNFAAEDGNHDDIVMSLVNFGWLTSQRYFKESINNNIRQVLQEEILHIMDMDIVPFGVIDNHLDEEGERDAAGDWWEDRGSLYPYDGTNNYPYGPNWDSNL